MVKKNSHQNFSTRRKLPNRTPCSITKVDRHGIGYYVIVDFDPKTLEPRGLHCHGPKPGGDMWTILHEILPLISRQIQMSGKPLKIASTFTKRKGELDGPKRFSVLGDIVNVFVKEYKTWMDENGIQR
jgi:hypothetical protein